MGRAKVVLVAGLLMVGAACATTPAPISPTRSAYSTGWADSVLASLTLRQKAAQLVWAFTLGDFVPDDSRSWRQIASWIQNDEVGGFIMSVGSPTEISAKLNRMQTLSRLPLIFSADFEAGTGFRTRGGYFLPNAIDLGGGTLFPPEMAIGATGDPTFAHDVGVATAREGRALGVHIDFTPVLDVNNNPANPVINTRSYGENPREVARFGAQMIRGLQEGGMIATGKHFPGHGDTDVNSHLALPVISVSRARLDSVELVPFREAVRNDVGAIMSFHGILMAFDSTSPATLSSRVMTGVLRGELGFKGLIVSDAMDMRGGLIQFGLAESVKRGIAAGLDVILQPSDVTQAITAIVAGVTEGRYTESRLNESVLRVLRMKELMGLGRNRLVDVSKIPALVGDSSALALAAKIAERSITVVKDSLRQIPVGVSPAQRILSITFANRSDLASGPSFNSELRARYPNVREEYIINEDPGANYDRLRRAADSADVTIIGSYVGHSSTVTTIAASAAFTKFVMDLSQSGRPPIVIAFGNPYLLQEIPEVPAYVVAWGSATVLQRAAARAIAGAVPISGSLPITIPPSWPRGTGLHLPARPAPPPLSLRSSAR